MPTTRYPATIPATLPPAVSGTLSYYTDNVASLQPVLAPAGWHCSVAVGADGSTTVDVVAPQDPLPTGFTGQLPTTDEAVTAITPAACQGCIYSMVCPFVPASGLELSYAGLPCHESSPPQESANWPPPQESVTWLRGPAAPGATTVDDTIAFEDPPGVAGDATPSGGPYPANGILRYRWQHGGPGTAAAATCTLPQADHSICTAILNAFAASGWGLFSG
ncbi:MAG: hypothetical protein M0Z63_03350 [Actinomycetota bacterium]|nr:hypothetical protein [Actinomycetota bacterium]